MNGISGTFPYLDFTNIRKILANTDSFQVGETLLTFKVTASNATHIATASLDLLVNTPPSGGSLNIVPTTGTAFTTEFTFTANGWIDDGLPMLYEFLFIVDTGEPVLTTNVLAGKQFKNTVTSLFAGSTNPIQIILNVYDVLDYVSTVTSSITVTPTINTLPDAATILPPSMATYDNDPKVVSMVLSDLAGVEINENMDESSACPSCSGNGYCSSSLNKCICNAGFSYMDCSIADSLFDQVVDLKKNTLQVLYDDFTGDFIGSDAQKKRILAAVDLASQNPYINTKETFEIMNSMLEDLIHIRDSSTILSSEDQDTVLNVLDHMLTFANHDDCLVESEYTLSLADRTIDYLETISRSAREATLSSEQKNYSTPTVDVHIVKTTPCDLENIVVGTNPSGPTLTFKPDSSVANLCHTSISIRFYAFSDKLFTCDATPSRRLLSSNSDTKGRFAFKITNDENGLEVHFPYGVTVSIPGELKNVNLAVS